MVVSEPSANMVSKSGQCNLQACVTVPKELRQIIGRKQIYKSLSTFDLNVARERLHAKEAEIFKELDEASCASHPLALAALELRRSLCLYSNYEMAVMLHFPKTRSGNVPDCGLILKKMG